MNNETEIRRIHFTPTELHVRSAEGESGRTIEGYAILFNTPSRVLWADEDTEAREVISPEAITRELLDGCDIKMTLFHNRQLVLARSRGGKGTLSYEVDAHGVRFSFEAPNTVDGDRALSLVSRGDLSGCSFTFATAYSDRGCVAREIERRDGKSFITYRVLRVFDVRDFALVFDPAYDETDVNVRSLMECEPPQEEAASGLTAEAAAQIREMRAAKFAKF